jgi:rare lipoprotein A (peptidoglycan hydrolase)
VPRDSTGKLATRLVTRPFGAAAALVLAVVVSLFGTSLSVGRQPVPIGPIDPSAFTVIVPPAASDQATPTNAPPGIFTDFRNPAAGLSRVAASVPLPRRQFVRTRSTVARVASQAVTTTVGNTRRVKGVATWYCLPGVSSCTSGYRGGLYAAAGSELRIGNWRGRHVKVCGNGNCVVVTLIDWCACGGSRIIDLYHDAFSRLASPSRGGIGVTVTW